MGDAVAMPFDRGTVSYRRFALEGWSTPPSEALLESLKAAARVDEGEGPGAGWTAGEHLFDADFSPHRNLFGVDLLAAVRLDSDRVPSEVKRAYLLSAMAEEMAAADADRTSRKRARDTAMRRCDAEVAEGRWRRRKLVPVLAAFDRKVALVPAKGDAVTTAVRTLLEESLACSATALSSGSLAVRLADGVGLAGAASDAEPETLGPGEGGDGQEGRPSPPWCDESHPMDFLGNAFLLWAWWKSERDAPADEHGTVILRKAIEFACPWDSTGSVVVRSDDPAARLEVRTAMRCGKWPRRAGLILAREGEAWEFTLHADRWEVSGLRLAAPEAAPASRREAIEGRLEGIRAFDAALVDLYSSFLRERLGPSWSAARASLARWVRESKPRITREAVLVDG
jgi:hypothetical protein